MKINIPQIKEKYIKYTVIIFVVLMLILVCTKLIKEKNPEKIIEEQKNSIFSKVDKNNNVNVTQYKTYGTHFNIEGTLNVIKISGISINSVELVLKNLNGAEIRCEIRF